ncbi:Arg81 protein [Maudiozyma humilis]|uniref:Arg81 protein n=1 Tax=Maudiozyma humilis TaxID=51915 RepID=A0AAV5RZJ9_MAUHU|nr:Arg81 protein [Kazachstania humilis]
MAALSGNAKRKPKRAKTFTGCWTCRARKVKCDLKRPGCMRCDKSGLECGGYDIKLRWSNLVKFDEYGVQVSGAGSANSAAGSRTTSNNNTESNSPAPATPNDSSAQAEKQFQRRNIDFVRYKDEYVFHEDMDDELTELHAPPPDKIADGKTWIIKKFGVFRALPQNDTASQQQQSRRRNTKKRAAGAMAVTNAQSSPEKPVMIRQNNDSNAKKQKLPIVPQAVTTSRRIETPVPEDAISPEIYEAEKEDVLGTTSVSGTAAVPTPASKPPMDITNHQTMGYNGEVMNFPGFEWISKELREDVLLSAFASQGTPFNVSYLDPPPGHGAALADPATTTTPNTPTRHTTGDSNERLDSTVQSALNSLFHKPSEIEARSSQNQPHLRQRSPTPKESTVSLETVSINTEGNDTGMPKSVMETLVSAKPQFDITESLRRINIHYDIPETGLLVHGLTRFLLTYYFDKVADLMTVVSLPDKNPWKTLYFPRALAALGDLAGIGHTSNSRNCLLNALLAVSCFNLKTKLPKNSQEQTFFLNLGIEFRTQATGFLKTCLSKTVQNERYKDVLTAILSMNSIDVVWGTMSDCQQHLSLGETFIENRMKSRPRLSEKARTLHRIFSFLKLIQDSTSLDKVSSKEIEFSNKDNSENISTRTGNEEHARPITMGNAPEEADRNNGQFKESLNSRDGKIEIEFVKSNPNTPGTDGTSPASSNGNLSPPIFKNITSESFYHTKSSLNSKMDIVDIETLYGLPNSLILLFSDCVRIVRHIKYYNMEYEPVPRKFMEVSQLFEKKLLKWKPEWEFYSPSGGNSEKKFLNPTIEGLYHHTMSFYYGLVIYFFSMARDLSNNFLQNYVRDVLKHLNRMNFLIEHENVKIVPLIWQGFIAGCACTSAEEQAEFKKWAAKLAESGMGSYWGARQVMFEVWHRRKNNIPGDDWFSVYQDWEMNLMLS